MLSFFLTYLMLVLWLNLILKDTFPIYVMKICFLLTSFFSFLLISLFNFIVDDCYFCVVKIFGYNAKNKHKIIYPSVPSAIIAIIPEPHSDEFPQPVFHELPSNDVPQDSLDSLSLCTFKDLKVKIKT